MNYVLPNRKAFADSVTRTLLKYRKLATDAEDADVDLCAGVGGTNIRELLPHQKVVRDYLMIETPYRGLLLYHGLGSGKTCSSIAVAESMLSTKKVFVMLPASLEDNYRGELRKCGDPLYMYDQHWRQQQLTAENREQAKKMGISDGFLDRNRTFFTTVTGEAANYRTLPKPAQDIISAQIEDIIDQRFTFIRYNGLSTANIGKYVPADGSNPYSGSVVIIDEVHNFISRTSNKSAIAAKLYNLIYTATDCKVIALSGTPVINRANEVAYLMNLLRGPIERIIIPIKAIPAWDEERMTTALRAVPDVDTIEYNAVKKLILVTRNPPHFRSIYSEKGDRTAVQYVKDMPWIPLASKWVKSFAPKFQTDIGGAELAVDRVSTESFECLPTDYDEFAALFLEGLTIKNPLLLARRIQGLVSYFKGADERMLPRRVDDDKMLEKIPMSEEQFNHYLVVRSDEIKQDARKKMNPMRAGDDEMKTFRVNSRLACDYAIPPDLQTKEEAEPPSEDDPPLKEGILAKIRASPDRYLTKEALSRFSPKMLQIFTNIMETGSDKNQLLYSQYKSLEGIGVFTAILEANGWQPYRILQDEGGQWIEDPAMDPDKPAYGLFTGGAGMVSSDVKSDFSTARRDAIKQSMQNKDIREYMRQIFNGVGFSDTFPASLKASVEARPKKILSLFMITAAGAEGITLANVRRVHIMEPHWNPARHDQVVGRAVRLCSHARLPVEERTVRVSFYISVFTEAQIKSSEGVNVVLVRRSDMATKRYEGDPVEVFMSTDEYLYEKTWEKDRINSKIALILKQAAVDCEIHRKLHSRETPVITCMRFDSTVTGEDLAFKPNIKMEDLDSTYLRNLQRRKRRLQKVSIKGMIFLIDPDTKEVFDGPAFEDNNRLMRMGDLTSATQIQWVRGLQLT
jgi:hypothetical protein